MSYTATLLADQLIEYLESGRINPLECWPLLEQLDAELDRVLGPAGNFPNCYPRLLARTITDSIPTLWLLDFSVPDVDHAHAFRGTRAELVGAEMANLRAELLAAVRGWRRKLDQLKALRGQLLPDDWVQVPLKVILHVQKVKSVSTLTNHCKKYPEQIRRQSDGVYLIRRRFLERYLEGWDLKHYLDKPGSLDDKVQ